MDLCVVQSLLLVFMIWVGDGATSKLTVTVPPVLEAKVGDDIEIPCQWRLADGEHTEQSAITLVWLFVKDQKPETRIYYRKGGIHFPENRNLLSFDVDKNFTLIIRSLRLEDEIKVTCKVSSFNLGIQEATAQVNVFAEPDFEHEVTDKVVDLSQPEVNDNVEIGTCVLKNGHPKPSSITWYKSGVSIPHDNVTETVTEDSGKWTVRSTLRYRLTRHDHRSQFLCKALYRMPRGYVSKASSNATLTVKYPPTTVHMTVEPPDGKVKSGGDVTFSCTADGNPQPGFTFFKEPHRHVAMTRGVNGSKVRLLGVTAAEMGKYGCQVVWQDRPLVGLEPATAIITVSSPPVVVLKIEPTEAKDWLRLSCMAMGFPRPSIAWSPSAQLQDKEINETAIMQTMVISQSAQSSEAITCIASNTAGTAQDTMSWQHAASSLSWLKEMWKEASAVAGAALVFAVACIAIAVACCRKRSRKKGAAIAPTPLEVKADCGNGKVETAME